MLKWRFTARLSARTFTKKYLSSLLVSFFLFVWRFGRRPSPASLIKSWGVKSDQSQRLPSTRTVHKHSTSKSRNKELSQLQDRKTRSVKVLVLAVLGRNGKENDTLADEHTIKRNQMLPDFSRRIFPILNKHEFLRSFPLIIKVTGILKRDWNGLFWRSRCEAFFFESRYESFIKALSEYWLRLSTQVAKSSLDNYGREMCHFVRNANRNWHSGKKFAGITWFPNMWFLRVTLSPWKSENLILNSNLQNNLIYPTDFRELTNNEGPLYSSQ